MARLINDLFRRCWQQVSRFSPRSDHKDRTESSRAWFSLSYELGLLSDLRQLASLDIDLDTDDDISISFRHTESQGEPESSVVTSIRCWAIGEFHVSKAIHAAFLSILSGGLDADPPFPISNSHDSPLVKRTSSTYEDGTGGRDEWVFDPSSLLPRGFEETQVGVYRVLDDAIQRTVRLLYWRSGTKLPRADLRRKRFEWSIDGKEWREVPRRMVVGAASSHNPFAIRLDIGDNKAFEEMVRSGIAEPVGHDVFIEAWQLRNAVPRAAIVLGIAAAEVGIKECLGKLAPDTVRLLDRLQTPPITELLKNYLPTLQGRNPGGKIIAPPQTIRKVIASGVETRNRIAHRAVVDDDLKQRLGARNVESLLLAVSDLLWFLDYYSGEDWALNHIRSATLAEWRRISE